MKQQVVGSRLAVKLVDQEERSESGIVLFRPDSTDPDRAEIIGVGQGTKTKKGKFLGSVHQVGEHVMIPKGTGTPVKIDGIEMLIIDEDDVLGVVDD